MKGSKLMSIWDKVASTFGKIGPKYWDEFGSRLVELSSIDKGSKVLDIGMGRGASLFPAINKVGEKGYVVGIDISEGMVREAYKDILKLNMNNIEVKKMDGAKLEFPDNSFDNVICGFGIGYLLYSESKLTEALRVLISCGQVAFSIWGIQKDQRWLTEITSKYLPKNSSENKNEKPDIPKFDTVEDVKTILEESGFRNVKVCIENNVVVYKSKEEWWEEMHSNAVRATFERVGESGNNKLQELKEEIFSGLEEYKYENEFHFNMPVIYAFGEK